MSKLRSPNKLIWLHVLWSKPGLHCVELGSTYTHLYEHIILFFLNLPQKFLMSPAHAVGSFPGGFCYRKQSVVCRTTVGASFLDEIKQKNTVVAQRLVSDVGDRCECVYGLEPWVQDVTSWSKALAGVAVIWRCSWNLISSRTVFHKLCKLSLAK